MAIPFKPAQLKELLQRHQALQSTLREAAGYEAETRSQAALAAGLLQQELLREVFRGTRGGAGSAEARFAL